MPQKVPSWDTPEMDSRWEAFANCGDEWLAAYACLEGVPLPVVLFVVGHALELHIKAAYAKLKGSVSASVKRRHELPALWRDCVSMDVNFMPEYELRSDVLAADLLDSLAPNSWRKLPPEDQLHFGRNQSFYLIMKHLQDLKYWGLPWKTRRTGRVGLAAMFRDQYWINMFKAFRSYLGHPSPPGSDHLTFILQIGNLPRPAVRYLRQLYD